MSELSRSQKYTDAFWRLAPIPLLVGSALVTVTLRATAVAVVAGALLLLVGTFAEVLIWRHLRLRWAKGVSPESVGQLVEPGSRQASILGAGLLSAAIIGKAFGVADTTADALIVAAIGIAIYGAAALIGGFKDRP